ncbi:uncharacterized protein BO80DRAFT_204396 [Aspergillus ibericus CBS 121593]|uniref:Uncharacterized protein n=1 Tax=Aspergillus ibericus CBS 121593 TaxID=1448316 RepID=A0A395H9R9_9EURO|nr:hypothetical protein BO80DRAFT_204396 [Aspergillus ibericus CBS 121593]RAL04602.1 hypothetical protein BO80DRAFT_204396 [Aspergillus ibericus CBS 121593]
MMLCNPSRRLRSPFTDCPPSGPLSPSSALLHPTVTMALWRKHASAPKLRTVGVGAGVGVGSGPDGEMETLWNPGPCNDPLPGWVGEEDENLIPVLGTRYSVLGAGMEISTARGRSRMPPSPLPNHHPSSSDSFWCSVQRWAAVTGQGTPPRLVEPGAHSITGHEIIMDGLLRTEYFLRSTCTVLAVDWTGSLVQD